MATAHIKAEIGDFGKTVLMPGDPLRAKFIAETFLENPVLVNNVRGVQGYTGTYKGVKISVMASGMGMPSIGIYSFELYNFFGVENIMRIGSAGALTNDIQLRDIVMGMGACTNSNFACNFNLPGTYAPICDFTMLRTCVETAEELNLNYKVGNILSSDTFYRDAPLRENGALPDFEWGEKMIAHYKSLGIDPKTKTLLFSDSLNFERADKLMRHFNKDAKVAFGIGTYISNDTSVEPLNIVMKVTKCNGSPVAKISDVNGKGMCKDPEYVEYLQRCIDWRMKHE